MSNRTAIIGLGAMGQAMAENILAAGISLSGYDISPKAMQSFAKAGGQSSETAADAAWEANLVILMVVNAAQAEDVLFGAGDVADAMARGGTVMLCSTVAPSDARAISDRLTIKGMRLLDAPVSGGQAGAKAGTLTVMASGEQAAFDRAEGVLAAIAGEVKNLGTEPGIGATYKVVHQLAAGVHLAAGAELMALGTKAGCDPQMLYDIVMGAAGQSWMFGDRGQRMMQEDPAVTSSVDIFIKDLDLVTQTARDAGAPTPLAAAALQMFIAARGLGHGKDDDSLVIRAYEAQTGAPAFKKTKNERNQT